MTAMIKHNILTDQNLTPGALVRTKDSDCCLGWRVVGSLVEGVSDGLMRAEALSPMDPAVPDRAHLYVLKFAGRSLRGSLGDCVGPAIIGQDACAYEAHVAVPRGVSARTFLRYRDGQSREADVLFDAESHSGGHAVVHIGRLASGTQAVTLNGTEDPITVQDHCTVRLMAHREHSQSLMIKGRKHPEGPLISSLAHARFAAWVDLPDGVHIHVHQVNTNIETHGCMRVYVGKTAQYVAYDIGGHSMAVFSALLDEYGVEAPRVMPKAHNKLTRVASVSQDLLDRLYAAMTEEETGESLRFKGKSWQQRRDAVLAAAGVTE